MKIFCHAPAKINLALHITGQRKDGYHLLDTLVVFTEMGDELVLSMPQGLMADKLDISGPFSDGLSDDEHNLILRAVRHLREALVSKNISAPAVHIELLKKLPLSSGIGGGSADAAATLRGLKKLWNFQADDALLNIAKQLGADVPMCLQSNALRAQGVGDKITLLDSRKKINFLLVNPGIGVSTMDIFHSLTNKNNSAMEFFDFPETDALSNCRNDLQNAAVKRVPAIRDVLDAMSDLPDIQFSRMSGSGATCFGIFETADAATNAELALSAKYPDWWIKATQSLNDREELDRVIQ